MALKLALLEGALFFTAIYATIVHWARPVWVDWLDVVSVMGQIVVLALSCIAAFYYNDLYDLRIVRSFGDFLARLLQAVGVAFILLAGFYTLLPETKVAEGVFVSSLLTILGLLLPIRALTYVIMRSRPFQERLLILGTSRLTYQIIEEIEAQPHCGYRVVGIVQDGVASPPVSRYPLRGPVEQLEKILHEMKPDRVVVAMAERRGRLPVTALLEARGRGVTVEEGVGTYEHLSGKLAIENLRPSTLVFSDQLRRRPLHAAIGRAVSFLAGLAGLIVCWPLLLLIPLVIKLDSRGPVLFAQDRIGRQGRRFTLYKFRTMQPARGETSEWVRDNAERVTRVGEWLRKYRLDELPQFVNILRGDMNLVGPRPHPVSNLELFRAHIPYYSLRTAVRPGVTGWAQIRYGYANDLEEETEKMRYDLYYIKHLSFWLDVRILFDTVKTVLFGRGAAATDAYPTEARVATRPGLRPS